ncbi:hypothetical protein [Ectobacillus panaciterrae]|uniref:hypothetical protein n=1 Tax=Ectobacillus panaciterrae TaxID=363872 RepID=UPI00040F1464|nr:hypothetical protein [Ectobacillus panaciterrae]
MKLYFKKECLGSILNVSAEGTWMFGTIEPNENMSKFQEFFVKLIDEEGFVEEDMNPEWLDEVNWFIMNDQQELKGIELPAIYEDGEINWRWR